MPKGLGLWLPLLGSTAALAPTHGFNTLPPEAYVDPVDREIARTHVPAPGRPVPCGREEIQNGIRVIVGAPTETCVRMGPPRRWRGLWRNDFEGSQFCPAPATTCRFDSPGERIWLSERPDRRPDGKLYRVDFIGRKTMYRGAYGHMGASDHEIVMDRMISSREIAK
jgi:hypothetical protein